MRIRKELLDNARKWKYYKHHPVEFFEDLCKIPTPGGDTTIKLFQPQKKIVNDFYSGRHPNIVVLKTRQIGFSTLFQLVCSHLVIFFKNAVIGVTSRSGAEASDFARKTKDIIDKLPEWVRPTYKRCNVQDFEIEGNGCQLFSSAITPSNPASLFRGKSICLLIMDEVAHITKVSDAWKGVAPTLSIAQKRAKENEIPFGTILLSTPNRCSGIGEFFYNMWKEALEGNNGFTPYRVHWSEIPEYKNDKDWYKNQCKILNNNPRDIQQELELQFVGDGNTFLPEKTVIELQSYQVDPVAKKKIAEGGEIWRFHEEEKFKSFCLIGVDTSSSYGEDYSTIQVLDWKTMNQLYEYRGKPHPKKLANIVKTITSFCPNNLIIVESTGGYGGTVLGELLYDEFKQYNIFYEHSRGGDRSKPRAPGLSTNPLTRPLIMEALYEIVTENPKLIKSERLKLELLSLTERKGKVQADSNSHDDLVLAHAFCCYVRKYYTDVVQIEEEVEVDSDTKKVLKDILEMNGIKRIQYSSLETEKDLEDFGEDIIEEVRETGVPVDRGEFLELIYGENFAKKFLRDFY